MSYTKEEPTSFMEIMRQCHEFFKTEPYFAARDIIMPHSLKSSNHQRAGFNIVYYRKKQVKAKSINILHRLEVRFFINSDQISNIEISSRSTTKSGMYADHPSTQWSFDGNFDDLYGTLRDIIVNTLHID